MPRLRCADSIRTTGTRAVCVINDAVICPLCGIGAPAGLSGARPQICAVCCGTKRLVQISCPSDCPYLASAREHPPAVLVRQQQHDLGLLDAVHARLQRAPVSALPARRDRSSPLRAARAAAAAPTTTSPRPGGAGRDIRNSRARRHLRHRRRRCRPSGSSAALKAASWPKAGQTAARRSSATRPWCCAGSRRRCGRSAAETSAANRRAFLDLLAGSCRQRLRTPCRRRREHQPSLSA